MQENSVRVQSILGKEVIALKDGSFIGKVQSAAINPSTKKVVGIYIKLKGILSGKNFIPFESIQSFGSHTITVKEEYESDVVGNGTLEEKDIINMPIITINGTMLGKIDDFTFEKDGGAIAEYILSDGLVQDTLRGKAVLNGEKVSRIGKDVIVALGEIDETGLEELDPFYEEIEENVENTFQEAQEEVKETVKETSEKVEEQMQETKEVAENAWQQSINNAKEVSEEWTNKLKDQAGKVGDEAKELWSEAQKTALKQLEKLNQIKEKWQEKVAKMGNTNQTELGDQLLNEIKGKTISKTLLDDYGNVLLEPGQEITDAVIKNAMDAGKLHDLFKLAAAKDVEDKIIEIEKIEE